MKKYLPILILCLLIIPSVTQAAWWNPLTWGHKDSSSNVSEPAPQSEVAQPVVKTETEPKVVTKTITVQDPKLQTQIDSLLQQIASLTSENQQQKSTIASLQATNAIQAQTIATLQSQAVSGGSKSVPVAKTRDQLEAQYMVAHPMPCPEWASVTVGRPATCNSQLASWLKAEQAWVTQQLASQ